MHKSASGEDFATTPALPSTAAGMIGSVSSHCLLSSLPPSSPSSSLLWFQPALLFPTILNYKVLTLRQLKNNKCLICALL